MTLSDLSIKNPVFAWMLMIGLMVFGWIGFSRMGISQMPTSTSPSSPSASLGERRARDHGDAGRRRHRRRDDEHRGHQQHLLDLGAGPHDRHRRVQAQPQHRFRRRGRAGPHVAGPALPAQGPRRARHQKVNPEDQPIMWLALRAAPGSNTELKDLCRYISEHLKDELAMTPGVGNIFLGGFVDPNLRVWLDSEKMAKREITVEDVLDAINTEHADVPAGYLDEGARSTTFGFTERLILRKISPISDPRAPARGSVYRTIRFSDIGSVETASTTCAASRATRANAPWAWASSSSAAPTRSRSATPSRRR